MNDTIRYLDDWNSRLYEPKTTKTKHAVLRWDPADYKLEWGEQTFDGPHMLVDGEYGCALEEFFTTHKPADDKNTWVKVANVRAKQVKKPTDIVTVVDGREEAKSTVEPGGWVIQNPKGELYYNTDEEFQSRYQEII